MRHSKESAARGIFRPVVLIRWSVAAAALAVLWLVVNFPVLRDYFEARGRRNENKREVTQLERQLSGLEEEKRELDTWGFPAEKAVRERFKMIKPGEKVILLDETPTAPSPALRSPDPQKH